MRCMYATCGKMWACSPHAPCTAWTVARLCSPQVNARLPPRTLTAVGWCAARHPVGRAPRLSEVHRCPQLGRAVFLSVAFRCRQCPTVDRSGAILGRCSSHQRHTQHCCTCCGAAVITCKVLLPACAKHRRLQPASLQPASGTWAFRHTHTSSKLGMAGCHLHGKADGVLRLPSFLLQTKMAFAAVCRVAFAVCVCVCVFKAAVTGLPLLLLRTVL